MMKGITKLEKGGWTLSLQKMAIDVMDKMILRPVTILVSDPRNGNINTFQGIRDKIIRKKYAFLTNWRDDVLKVFTVARGSNNPLINDICTELEEFFNKKYSILEEFSEFKFRDSLSRLLREEGIEIEIEEKTEEIPNNEISEQKLEEVQEVQISNESNENNEFFVKTNEESIQDNQENNFQDIQNVQSTQDNVNAQESIPDQIILNPDEVQENS